MLRVPETIITYNMYFHINSLRLLFESVDTTFNDGENLINIKFNILSMYLGYLFKVIQFKLRGMRDLSRSIFISRDPSIL